MLLGVLATPLLAPLMLPPPAPMLLTQLLVLLAPLLLTQLQLPPPPPLMTVLSMTQRVAPPVTMPPLILRRNQLRMRATSQHVRAQPYTSLCVHARACFCV